MSKAVFLSYAREDASAVKLIAEALRAVGVEVWFDANELRGGDAWDAVINKQIRECTLFLPVISAQTELRHEGYFRREWRLGVERTKDMSESVPFLVPILIDDLNEKTADVPADFRRVHWTRLPGGQTDAAFTAHIRELLEGGPRIASSAGTSAHELTRTLSSLKNRKPMRMIGLAAAAVICVALVLSFWPKQPPPVIPANVIATNPVPAAKVSDKSIAVLPFTNRSADANDAYFAEGIHEDIVTQLTGINAMQVASMTAVKRYKEEVSDLHKIGEQLKVRYILQGSVRRAGHDVRVSVQLTDASSSMNVWAENFDRKLENIFILQSDIARQIATQLKAQISSAEDANLDKIPTRSVAAYDDYLKARSSLTSLWVKLEVLSRAVDLLHAATEADPKFVDAWALLATVHSIQEVRISSRYQKSDADESFAQPALAALRTAQALNPKHISTFRAEGYYHLLVDKDYVAAAASIDQAVTLMPNDIDNLVLLSIAYNEMGQPEKCVSTLEQAYQLDPVNPVVVGFLRGAYDNTNDYSALLRLYQDQLRIDPERNDYALRAKYCQFLIDGKLESFKAYESALAGLEMTERCDAAAWKNGRMVMALLKNEFDSYAKDWTERWEAHYRGHGNWVCPVQINAEANYAAMLVKRGDTAGAHKIVEKSLVEVTRPQNPHAGCTFDVEMITPKLALLDGDPAKARVEFEHAVAKLSTKENGPKKYFEKEVLLETASMVAPDRAFEIYQDIQKDPIRTATLETVCANPWTYPGLLADSNFRKLVKKDGRFVEFLTTYGFLSEAAPVST